MYSYLDRLLSRVICGNLVITNDNLVQKCSPNLSGCTYDRVYSTNSEHTGRPWNLPHKFHLYLIKKWFYSNQALTLFYHFNLVKEPFSILYTPKNFFWLCMRGWFNWVHSKVYRITLSNFMSADKTNFNFSSNLIPFFCVFIFPCLSLFLHSHFVWANSMRWTNKVDQIGL